MKALHIKTKWGKDAWLWAALALAVALCLMLGAVESASTGQTEDEARLARVLSAMEGAGQVEAAIFYTAEDDAAIPCGAVIVAQGAEDVSVRLRLTRAACTLLGLEPDQVEVFKRKGGDP